MAATMQRRVWGLGFRDVQGLEGSSVEGLRGVQGLGFGDVGFKV